MNEKRLVDWRGVGRLHAQNGFAFAPATAHLVSEQMAYAEGYIDGEGAEELKATWWLRDKKREIAPVHRPDTLVYDTEGNVLFGRPRS